MSFFCNSLDIACVRVYNIINYIYFTNGGIMVNEKMRGLGACRSVIRELFEYGKKRKAEIGNVYNFSISSKNDQFPLAVTVFLTDKSAVFLLFINTFLF